MLKVVLAIALNTLGGLFSAPPSPGFCPEYPQVDHKKEVLKVFEEDETRRETKKITLLARL